MRNLVLPSAALALVLVTSEAYAGWQIEQTLKGERDVSRQQVLVQANRMKTVMFGDDGRPMSAAILDLNTDTITHVEYGRRRYFTLTTQEMIKGLRDARQVMAGGIPDAVKEQMKHLPPDQRRAIEEMMRARAGQDGSCAQGKVDVRNTGQRATIAGFPAVRHEVLVNGSPDSEVWTARDITAWRELDRQKLATLMTAIAEASPQCGPAQASAMFKHTETAWKLEASGYPVRMSRGRESSVEVQKAEQRTIPEGEFAAPAGFQKMTMDQMMGTGQSR